jgi:hypothetical protein
MANLIIYSDCISSLLLLNSRSSSEKYELSLTREISRKYRKVYVLSKGAPSVKTYSNITLIPVGGVGAMIWNIWKNKLYRSPVISFGYDLKKILIILLLKCIFRIRNYSFVFDRHELVCSNMSFYKRKTLDIYFKIGLFFLRFNSGVVVFTLEALDFFKNQPVLLSNFMYPKYRAGNLLKTNFNQNDKFTLVFAGTCGVHNMTAEIIEAFSGLDIPGISLKIFGPSLYGSGLEERVKSISNIKLYGVVTEKELAAEEANADVLISARRNFHEWLSFSKPSKNQEMLASNKVLIMASDEKVDEMISDGVIKPGVRISDIRQAIKISYTQFEHLQHEATQRSIRFNTDQNNVEILSQLHGFISGGEE